jgi:hypothetical protein
MDRYIKLCISDFDEFINYIEENKPKLTSKVGVFGKKDSYRINSLIKYRRDVDGPKYNQDQYPIIDFMFEMVMISQLYYKGNNEKDKSTLVETPYLKKFFGLNDIEKYIYLLENYWTKYEFHVKFDSVYYLDSYYKFFIDVSKAKSGERIIKNENTISRIMYSWGALFLHQIKFLGFGDLEMVDGAKGRNEDTIKAFIPNEFGINTCKFLIAKALPFWNGYDLTYTIKNKKKVSTNTSIKPFNIFKNIIPGFTVNKTIEKTKSIDRNGIYTFKISLSKNLWRKIQLSGKHTLTDLHTTIQSAFEFDDDHLYVYYFGGKKGKAIYCADAEDYNNKTTEETKIFDLELFKGQSFIYFFDFGDEWEFKVELVEYAKSNTLPIKPVVIESRGESPDQYGYGL